MSEYELWPKCAVCTEKADGYFMPVEQYEIIEEKSRSLYCTHDAVIIAKCSHDGSQIFKHQVRVEVPVFWTENKFLLAVSRLMFFAPGITKPDHGLVTNIG